MNADRSLPTVAIDTTETIWRHFAAVAANQPDRLAIVDGARQWTYRELHDQSVAYARAFLAQGVEHGDHVAVWLKNCAEWIAAQLALAQIGAVLVPLNTRFKAEEIRYCLHQSDAVLLHDSSATLDDNVMSGVGGYHVFRQQCEGTLEPELLAGTHSSNECDGPPHPVEPRLWYTPDIGIAQPIE